MQTIYSRERVDGNSLSPDMMLENEYSMYKMRSGILQYLHSFSFRLEKERILCTLINRIYITNSSKPRARTPAEQNCFVFHIHQQNEINKQHFTEKFHSISIQIYILQYLFIYFENKNFRLFI